MNIQLGVSIGFSWLLRRLSRRPGRLSGAGTGSCGRDSSCVQLVGWPGKSIRNEFIFIYKENLDLDYEGKKRGAYRLKLILELFLLLPLVEVER